MFHLISYDDFSKVEQRVGRIIAIEDFPEAKKPAYKLTIDFGLEIGIKKSSAQITKHYNKRNLLGRLIVAVINFAPKQIGPFMSECLVCGAADKNGDIHLLSFEEDSIPLGSKIF